MSKYNITMKQKSDSDYNELYPESLDTQIKLSKDTTGFTGTNVSQVLMELNNKIGESGGGEDYLPLTGGNIRGNVNIEGNFGFLKNSDATEPKIAFELNEAHINVTNSGTEFVLQSGHVNYPLVAISKRSGNGSNSITIPTSFKADFLIYYADSGGLTEGVFMYSISKGIYSITLGNAQINGSNLNISATSSQIKIIFNSVGEFTANRFNSGLVEYCVYIVGVS
jgi:hypothetical protein